MESLMRNGIPFNKLTLVDNSPDPFDDAAAYYPYQPAGENASLAEESHPVKTTLLVFMAVSLACATAAIATGSYAAWLARHQSARQALTDVNAILMSCQSRMRQLEADVQRLPNRQA
jgi:hypothetical protein